MFEGIQKSLSDAFKTLRGRGRLSEANIREGMREVRKALLEADVNFNVVNEFIQRVTERSVGQEVLARLDPSEQIIRIVYDELVQLMGPVDHRIPFAKDRPTVLMLCGLQGSGKTTTAGKLRPDMRDRGRKPLLVAADLQRPAAVDQLKILGEQLNIPVYTEAADPVAVCRNSLGYAKSHLLDTVLLDTAGRLHVDEMPMDELRQIDKVSKPDQVFLVCDAMTGQDAVNSAKAFHEALELNGVILTKMDGDARGGAALSIKEVTQVPIKFIGVGEKLDRLEEFYPERMAQRILGQGDLMGLVEKVARVQAEVSQEELQKQQEKLQKGDLTLQDFRNQFAQLHKMGMKDLISRMPGMSDMIPEGEDPEVALQTGSRHDRLDDVGGAAESRLDRPESPPADRRWGGRRAARDQAVHRSVRPGPHPDAADGENVNLGTNENGDRPGKSRGVPPGANVLKSKVGTGHRKSAKERAEERKKKRKQDKKGKR